jgi:hypothetical protein
MTTRHLCLALALVAACTDSSDWTTAASDVPITGLSDKMYPLANPSLTPLAPINSVTKAVLTQACVEKASGQPIDFGTDFTTQQGESLSYVQYARSRTQVDDALSVKVAASFSSPFAAASAEVEASSERVVRGDSIYLLGELIAYVHHVLQASCPMTLTENGTDLLTDDSAFGEVAAADKARYRAAAFMRVCGDGWTHSRQMGAGGTLILEWQAKSSSAKDAIRAELSASYGGRIIGAKIGVSVAASKSKLQSEATLKTTLVTKGAIAGMPSPDDIDGDPNKLSAIVGKLDDLVKKLNDQGGDVSNLAPMAARLAAYNGLPPWKGWKHYSDEDKAKIRTSLELIKPLAEEMEKFLVLRASLVKELETMKAQIAVITEKYPNYFNYDGANQWNFAGTAILPTFGLEPNHADVNLYKPRFDTLLARLRAEMQTCVDSGNQGFIKCKPSDALPKLVAKDIVKWRTNRPRMIAAYLAPFANSTAAAAEQCKTWDKKNGRVILRAETKFVRLLVGGHLYPTDGHKLYWLGDPVNGEKCDSGQLVHSRFHDATDNVSKMACGQPWNLGTVCMPKDGKMWDDAYWKDELDLAALGLL